MEGKKVGDPIDLENWFYDIEEYTFKTTFIDLTVEEAESIAQYYADLKQGTLKVKGDNISPSFVLIWKMI